MLKYTNTQRYENLQFEEYLKLDCYSHSYLKNLKNGIEKDFIETDKIRLGKMCDELLTGGHLIFPDLKMLRQATQICEKINLLFGDSIKVFKNQVSYTSRVEDEVGIGFDVSGRLDWEIPKRAVIDLKINHSCKSVSDCHDLIEFMGYDNQLWNYKKLLKSYYKLNHIKCYLMIYSTKVNDVFFLERLSREEDNIKSENWWEQKVQEYGNI